MQRDQPVAVIPTAIYCRMSQDRSGDGSGVERQETECRQLIGTMPGYKEAEVYIDNDVSASNGKKRPAYERMLADIEAGRIRAVVAWHTDRIHRSPVELERYIDTCTAKKGAEVATFTVKAGALDLATPAGRMVARQLGSVARYEIEQKSARQKSKNRQVAMSGEMPNGGPVPFGFQPDRKTTDPKAAGMVHEAHTALLRGDSLRSIIKAWNASGITAPRGGKWTYSNVRGVLTRPLNAGFVLYDGAVLPGVEGKWERLVTAEEHHAVVALLADPSRRTTDTSRRKHFLPGIARCGTCGSGMRSGVVGMRPLKGETEPRKHRIYRCINADCAKPVRIAMAKLDAEVERQFLAERGEEAAVKIIRFDADQAGALADVEARIKGVTARLGDDGADMDELMQRLAELKAERATIKKTPSREMFKAGQVKLDWEEAEGDLERRREILLGHLEDGGLRIAPRGKVTHRFDPTRVEIAWRELGPVADVEYVTVSSPGENARS